MPKLILASASPRRLDLLKSINIKPDIIFPANIDESIKKKEKPNFYLKRISFEKALYAQDKYKDDIILSADTIVTTNHEIFGKPSNEKEAVKTLKYLSGRNHKVKTGVCILFKKLKKIKIIINPIFNQIISIYKINKVYVKDRVLNGFRNNNYFIINKEICKRN